MIGVLLVDARVPATRGMMDVHVCKERHKKANYGGGGDDYDEVND